MVRLFAACACVAAVAFLAVGCMGPGESRSSATAREDAAKKDAKAGEAEPAPKKTGKARKADGKPPDPTLDEKTVHAAPPIKFDLNRAMRNLSARHDQMETLLAENDVVKALSVLDAMETFLVQAQLQSGKGARFAKFAELAAGEVAAVSGLVRTAKWDEARKRYENVHASCAACHGVFRTD
jgi:hypothetical protein